MTIWELYMNEKYNDAFLIDDSGKQKYENTVFFEEVQNFPHTRNILIKKGEKGFPDFMNYWVTCGTWIVSSKVKMILEKEFNDLTIQFFPCICDQYPDVEMWIINVCEYHDLLDLKRCICDTGRNLKGEKVIQTVNSYAFVDDAFKYDMFKVTLPNRKYVTSLFVSDRFKTIMEENGVTGLALKKVYSF